MGNIVPDSKINLCCCPIKQDNKHHLNFASLQDQLTYFTSITQKTLNDYTYIRKTSQIDIEVPIAQIENCNYLFYKNNNYNKTYYCFITNLEYLNEETTRVSFKIDDIQTYYFDIIYNDSIIEREHVENDTFGLHTVPENLETGEFICNSHSTYTPFNKYSYVANVLEPRSSTTDELKNIKTTKVNGIHQQGLFYIYDEEWIDSFQDFLNEYVQAHGIDNIKTAYIAPSVLFGAIPSDTHRFIGKDSPYSASYQIPFNTTLNGYTPKNKKLLTRPFNYFIVSNNNGNSTIYNYEDFINSVTFEVHGMGTQGVSALLIPTNYKKCGFNYLESIGLGKFPTLSWGSDYYTNWLTQNSLNNTIGIVSTGINLVANPVNGITQAFDLLAQTQHLQSIPDISRGNTNNGDVNTITHANNFHFYKMSIKKEYAELIDKYFDVYGYKVLRIGKFNLSSRKNWNYIKTKELNITGQIPQESIQNIKNAFNNGITFWHNATNFLNYNADNSIVN